jgi:hypothetical protein
MRELHLPEQATERDLELAEQVARAFDSGELHVCWSEWRGPCIPERVTPSPAASFTGFLTELAGGLSALWDALVAGVESRTARPVSRGAAPARASRPTA